MTQTDAQANPVTIVPAPAWGVEHWLHRSWGYSRAQAHALVDWLGELDRRNPVGAYPCGRAPWLVLRPRPLPTTRRTR